MSYAPFTTWFIGLLNGHYKEGLPNSIVYSVLGTSTVISMIRGVSIIPTIPNITPPQGVAGLLFVPIVVGSTYFLGNQVGQALRHGNCIKLQ